MSGPLRGTQVGKADLVESKIDHNERMNTRCEP
jgi:hypothetical protein